MILYNSLSQAEKNPVRDLIRDFFKYDLAQYNLSREWAGLGVEDLLEDPDRFFEFTEAEDGVELTPNIRNIEIAIAAAHFKGLYKEELDNDEVSSDTIYEWWGMTVDQYSSLKREDVNAIEELIL